MESIHGVTAESMKVTTKWIRNTDMVYTSGQMDAVMKVTGLQENNMVKVNMFYQMAQFVWEFGTKVNVHNGLTNINQINFNIITQMCYYLDNLI